MEKAAFKNALPLLVFLIAFAAFAVAAGFSTNFLPDRLADTSKPPTPITIRDLFTDSTLGYVPGEVVVKFKLDIPNDETPNFLSGIAEKYEIKSIEKIFKDESEPPFSRFFKLRFSEEADIEEIVKTLNKDKANIEYSEPNYLRTMYKTPNDPYFSQQWGLEKIEAPAAWERTTGSSSIIVAVVDTGVDYNHPDLARSMVSGYDFADGDNDPMDCFGHGTHVAGIIGAIGNNSEGITGVNWNVKIMPLKIFPGYGIGGACDGLASEVSVASAIKYAADNGARVINMSIGGAERSNLEEEAAIDAYNKNVLLVAAGGNCGCDQSGRCIPCDQIEYPAAFNSVVAVSNTTIEDVKNSRSNYWDGMELAAPGTDIISTWLNGYASASGTSMASPHVAGLAALILSANPEMSASALRTKLQQTADDIDPPGRDSQTGYGRINARKALEGAAPPPPPPPGDNESPTVSINTPNSGSTVSGQVTIGIEASDNVGVTKVAAYANDTLIGETGGIFQAQAYNGPIGAIAEGETQLNFMNQRFRSDDIINVKTEGMTAGYLEQITTPQKMVMISDNTYRHEYPQAEEFARQAKQHGADYLGFNLEGQHSKQELVDWEKNVREYADAQGLTYVFGPMVRDFEKYPSDFAQHTDYIVLQSQAFEGRSDVNYRDELNRILSLVKQAKPSIKVWVQVSVNPPNNQNYPAESVIQDIEAAGDLVDGFFVFYGGNRWEAARQVLEHFRPTDNPPPPQTHKECINEACVEVDGAGQDECQIDDECLNQPPPATYQIPWDTTQFENGQYTLVAKAWDAAENVGESSPVQVTVSNEQPPPPPPGDNQPPTVTITNPQNNSTVSGTVTIQANASDNTNVKRVDFYIEEEKVGADSFSPYSYNWDTVPLANNSSHRLQAKAYDDADNEGVSDTVTVTVNNTAPPPPPPGGEATLNFKVSNWSSFPDNIQVTITATDENGTSVPGLDVQTTTNTSGEGSVSLTGLTIGERYYFFVKGDKHLRKKSSTPTVLQEGANPPSGFLDFGGLRVGDANNDNQVTLDDLNIVVDNFRQSVPPGNDKADFNEDDKITLTDIVAAGANFGKRGD